MKKVCTNAIAKLHFYFIICKKTLENYYNPLNINGLASNEYIAIS